MHKNFLVSVCLVAFVVLATGAANAEQENITFSEVNRRFGSRSTSNELRKNEEWKAYKGKCVEWTGELVSVQNLFNEITLGFKHLRSTFTSDIHVLAPLSEKWTFMDMQTGNTYKYRATLRDYGGVILPIQADWGCDGYDVSADIEYRGIAESSDLLTDEDVTREEFRARIRQMNKFKDVKLDEKTKRKFQRELKNLEKLLLEDKEGLSAFKNMLGPELWKEIEESLNWIRQLVNENKQ